MTLQTLLGIEMPIIQAPMAGVQGSALAIAVSNAGGLGSLPCAMLGPTPCARSWRHPRADEPALQRQLLLPHAADAGCRARGRVASGAGAVLPRVRPATRAPCPRAPRAPFGADAADVLSEFKPAVVSFHFGLPSAELLARVRAWGAKMLSSATTVDEARWLEAHGVDAIIAQGLEAGGHRGMFLSDDLTHADRHVGAGAANRARR